MSNIFLQHLFTFVDVKNSCKILKNNNTNTVVNFLLMFIVHKIILTDAT